MRGGSFLLLEEKCEYCKYYEEDYDLECKDCRVDDGLVNYSKFELNDELEKLINLAEFNCCDCEFTYYEENCNCKYGDFIDRKPDGLAPRRVKYGYRRKTKNN